MARFAPGTLGYSSGVARVAAGNPETPERVGARWREAIGASGRIWAGPAARVVQEHGWWAVLSGLEDVDYNVVLVHGSPEGGHDPLGQATAALERAGVPGLVMLAGAGLAWAGELAERGFVCARAVPVMAARLDELLPVVALPGAPGRGSPGPGARLLAGTEIEALRALVAETFALAPATAAAAVPGPAALAAEPTWRAAGVEVDGELVAGGLSSQVDRVAGIWSMATRSSARRRGYGRVVLATLLAAARDAGARSAALLASEAGLPLYRQCGFAILEHWQVWSRPGWVLA